MVDQEQALPERGSRELYALMQFRLNFEKMNPGVNFFLKNIDFVEILNEKRF